MTSSRGFNAINPRLIGVFSLLLGLLAAFHFAHFFGFAFRPGPLVDFAVLESIEFDPRSAEDNSIPQYIRNLEGKRVTLEGEMFDVCLVRDAVTRFTLIRSGAMQRRGAPRTQWFIYCEAAPDKSVEYSPSHIVRVTGTFHVGVIREPNTGTVASLYRMNVERVEPAN